MFGGGFLEIGFLLFFRRLPPIRAQESARDRARTLGKGLGELRRASNELKNSLEEEIRNLDRPTESGTDTTSNYGHHDPEPTPKEPEPRS